MNKLLLTLALLTSPVLSGTVDYKDTSGIPVKYENSTECVAYADQYGIHICKGISSVVKNQGEYTLVLLHEQGHILLNHVAQMKALSRSGVMSESDYYRFEYQADNYAIQKSKELGYTSDICEVFDRQQDIIDHKHPLSSERYFNCIDKFN